MTKKRLTDHIREKADPANNFRIIMEAIEEGYDFTDSGFRNWLMESYIHSDEELLPIVKLMISKGYQFNKLVIFDLAKNGFFETMEYFKSLGYDLNVKNENNENALFYLIQRDISRFDPVKQSRRKPGFIHELIEKCIGFGIDEKLINNQGRNLFHAFSASGMHEEYFPALLKLDIDLNRVDQNNWTPLHYICAYNSDDNFYKEYLKAGADKTIYTKKRYTAFEDEFDAEPTKEVCSAFDLRMYHLDSRGGEYSKGTENYEYLEREIETLLKP